jgi:hypothetical protein
MLLEVLVSLDENIIQDEQHRKYIHRIRQILGRYVESTTKEESKNHHHHQRLEGGERKPRNVCPRIQCYILLYVAKK